MLISDALDAIKTRLETIDGLTVTTDPGVGVVPPMALVADGDVTYNATMGRGSDDIDVTATVYVSDADSVAGMIEARDYKSGHGSKSIRTALEASTGAADALDVAGAEVRADSASSGIAERGGGRYVAVTVSALVTVDGTA